MSGECWGGEEAEAMTRQFIYSDGDFFFCDEVFKHTFEGRKKIGREKLMNLLGNILCEWNRKLGAKKINSSYSGHEFNG